MFIIFALNAQSLFLTADHSRHPCAYLTSLLIPFESLIRPHPLHVMVSPSFSQMRAMPGHQARAVVGPEIVMALAVIARVIAAGASEAAAETGTGTGIDTDTGDWKRIP
jgi:hypothetical protein